MAECEGWRRPRSGARERNISVQCSEAHGAALGSLSTWIKVRETQGSEYHTVMLETSPNQVVAESQRPERAGGSESQ